VCGEAIVARGVFGKGIKTTLALVTNSWNPCIVLGTGSNRKLWNSYLGLISQIGP